MDVTYLKPEKKARYLRQLMWNYGSDFWLYYVQMHVCPAFVSLISCFLGSTTRSC